MLIYNPEEFANLDELFQGPGSSRGHMAPISGTAGKSGLEDRRGDNQDQVDAELADAVIR